MGGNEQHYINEAFKANWIAPLGPNVTGFEKAIEAYYNDGSHAAVLSAGTAAIHLSLIEAGVRPGDEVLCQSFTFSASANPITYLGALPVFVDSEYETWNLSPSLLKQAIEDGLKRNKKPAAIIAVHLYGMPYNVNEIHSIATAYDIPVIEDAAEALGSTYNNEKCGSFGDFGILSFNGNKIITTSGGGALLTKDPETKSRIVHLSTQARDQAPHYQHSKIGFNYRMSNVLAGIGRGQMEVLADRVSKRRKNFQYYSDVLLGYDQIEFLKEPSGYFSNRWLTTILFPSIELREKARIALEVENIESRPLWKPMHLQPIFKNNLSFVDGTAEDLFNRGLCLPSGSNLSDSDLERVTAIIIKSLAL